MFCLIILMCINMVRLKFYKNGRKLSRTSELIVIVLYLEEEMDRLDSLMLRLTLFLNPFLKSLRKRFCFILIKNFIIIKSYLVPII